MQSAIGYEFRKIFNLAIPLILNLLAYMAMQLVDTLMLGMLGPLALASAALGQVIFIIILIVCVGIISPVATLAAQAHAAGNQNETSRITQQGLWLSIFLSILAMLILWKAPLFLSAIKQPPNVIQGTRDFLFGLVWCIFPTLGFITLREFVTGISKPRIIMIISLFAIPFKILANYILMFGKLGFPQLNILGVGLATSVIDWGMFAVLIGYILTHHSFKKYKIFNMTRPRITQLRKIVRLGIPVGITFGIEESLFLVTALLMGYLGVVPLAAHQIAVQGMTFIVMIQIGLSQATAVRVSRSLGASSKKEVVTAAYVGIISGFLIAVIAACCVWLFARNIAGLFLNANILINQPVIILAIKLLSISAIFHIADATQIVTSGALRGLNDTFIPMVSSVISFWLMGIGSGYYFAFILKFGATGLWWGLAIGVTVSAILLQWRLSRQCRRLLYD